MNIMKEFIKKGKSKQIYQRKFLKMNKGVIFALIIVCCQIDGGYVQGAISYEQTCELKVINPSSLKDLFVKSNNLIPNIISPHGHIPLGKILSGKVEMASPMNACQPILRNPQSQINHHFLLVEMDKQDECSVETKIYHAQNHGAQIVIIILKELGIQQLSVMDENKLKLISIPIIELNSDVGESLKNAVINSTPDTRPTLLATFPTKKSTKYSLKIYADINSFETYNLISALGKYIQAHDGKYEMKIYYKIMEQILDDDENIDLEELTKLKVRKAQHCYGDGKYCDENPTTMREIITQTCIAMESMDKLFDYITLIELVYQELLYKQLESLYEDTKKTTYLDFYTESKIARRAINLNEERFQECFNSSFITDDPSHPSFMDQNIILDMHKREFEAILNPSTMPFLYLNDREIFSQTNYYTYDVQKFLCISDDDDSSDICSPFFKLKKNEGKGLSTGVIIMIVIGSLIGAVVVCFLAAKQYNKYRFRSYSDEMERIDSLVQSYIELNSDRPKDAL